MKFVVKHFEGGYQVWESVDRTERLIASFHKAGHTETGQKTLAQRRAEEYCDFLNQRDIEGADDLVFD